MRRSPERKIPSNIVDADRMEIEDSFPGSGKYKYPRIRPVILKAIYEIYYAPEVKKLIARVVGLLFAA